MQSNVNLYNNAYGNYWSAVYREIRLETYGEDLGQTSWVDTEESNKIPHMLGLNRDSYVLEIGSGSGRYALQLAATVGCRVLGIDANGAAIDTANQLAKAQGVSAQVRFEQGDASQKLPFDNATFDAAFANDVLCHLPGRQDTLREIFRVIRTGAKFLFSDALIIGGTISHQEIAMRSSIGYYIFSPPGENERLLENAEFRLVSVTDTTANAAAIAKRWHDARQARRPALVAMEGEATFQGLQKFLSTVNTLTSERKLLRHLYVAEKPRGAGVRPKRLISA